MPELADEMRAFWFSRQMRNQFLIFPVQLSLTLPSCREVRCRRKCEGVVLEAGVVPDPLEFAQFVMAREKAARMGNSQDVVPSPRAFFLDDGDAVTELDGSPFRWETPDGHVAMALVLRLFAHALDAQSMLFVSEAWTASRCAFCGAETSPSAQGNCPRCGRKPALPVANPHRKESLIGALSLKGQEKPLLWASRIERDADGRITGFVDLCGGEPSEMRGWFVDPWTLQSWMCGHFALNFPNVLRAFGKTVSAEWIETAEKAAALDCPESPLVRLTVHQLSSVMLGRN